MRASDLAYTRLREEIIQGDLSAGTVLAEVEQAQRIGVSRTPVREAFSRLIAEGLAAQAKGRGTVVSGLSLADIDHLFELRIPLETQAARLAAERGEPATFLHLAEEFAAVSASTDAEEHYRLAARMDAAIDEAAGNDYLRAALQTMRLHLVRARRLAKRQPSRLADSAGEHRQICLAIASGDPEMAAAAVGLHLRRSLNYITTKNTAGNRGTVEDKEKHLS
ncbi:GntR family transcriptional regulator [Nesterenkonia flava]|uniref:GntR family transcriptional regulator n=1 Tax=Nesterenkonia flava TaxID=469799 RepID=A0ABU1FTM4_9MICC|nr:GntR family transcriptional regulator [Nesterenkonia flava]MDR5712015.1 GntR family transcriptional regulator [Nesterenkonia flava]